MQSNQSAQTDDPHRRGDWDSPTGEITRPTLTDLPATMTAEELCAGFQRRYEGLKALEIEYSFTAHSFEGDERVIPFGQTRFAFMGESRFKAESGGGRHYPKTYPAQADGTHYYPYVFPHDAYFWNGELQREFHAGGIHANIEANKNTWVDHDNFLSGAGIPIKGFEDEAAACAAERCGPPWPLGLIDRPQDWEVLPRLELIDGAVCHVLHSKSRYVERLWIDPEVDFGVRFRDLCSRPLRSRLRIQNVPHTEWPVWNCLSLRDYRLIGGCFWLPWRVESVIYVNRHAIRRPFGRPANACVLSVSRLAVNEDVPQSLFTLQFPAGATVLDAVRKRVFKVGEAGTETMVNDLKE